MAPFNIIGSVIKDIFGGSAIKRGILTLKQIGLQIQSFFLYLAESINGLLQKVPDWLLPESAENFIDEMDAATKATKRRVDNDIESIKSLKAELKKKDELEEKLKAEDKESSAGSGGGGVNMQDGGTAVNTTNNVTYVIQNGSNVATDALQAAAG
jgi:hypothetical protein